MSYHVYSLYSGSGGNASYIEGENTKILIDAGGSAGRLCRELNSVGGDVNEIDAVFITHEHTDHVGALGILAKKRRIPVHMTEQSAANMVLSGELSECLVLHPVEYSVEIGDMRITSFPLSHDTCCCVGYRVDIGAGSVGIATDTGCMTDEMAEALKGCENVILESNYDRDMLRLGSYPRLLKERIGSDRGHLSNRQCSEIVKYLYENGTRGFLLAHLSEQNNTPEKALKKAAEKIKGKEVVIRVARADEAVMLV